MRIRTLTGMAALVIATAGAASPAAQDSKANDTLASAREAIGGKKLDSLKTLSVDASLQRNVNNMQLASEVEILLELPDKYVRSDASSGMMNMTMAMGFSGEKPIRPANAMPMAGGGMVIRMGPGGPMTPPEKLAPEEQEKADRQMVRAARADISRLMLGWFAMAHPAVGAEYTYAGEAESPDGKAHVIDVKNADGFSARLFIDQETRLPLMVTYQGPQARMITQRGPQPAGAPPQHGGQQPVRREMSDEERQKMRAEADKRLKDLQSQPPQMADYSLYFEDWRDVDGVKFPFKIRRAMSGATNEEWTVTRVKVNPKIDAKRFEG
jgi:hypothetical protein